MSYAAPASDTGAYGAPAAAAATSYYGQPGGGQSGYGQGSGGQSGYSNGYLPQQPNSQGGYGGGTYQVCTALVVTLATSPVLAAAPGSGYRMCTGQRSLVAGA